MDSFVRMPMYNDDEQAKMLSSKKLFFNTVQGQKLPNEFAFTLKVSQI